MKKLILEGGTRLRGTVKISGSKNSALPCLFATLLTDEKCVLENVPNLMDIDSSCLLLEHLGKKIIRENGKITVLHGRKTDPVAPYNLVSRMRASALVLGPLLSRYGSVAASLPGGCAIGNRPIDIHLDGLKALGARSKFSQGMVRLKGIKLSGSMIHLKFPSVGATENLLMAAVLARGKTVIHNVAREPEIVDLADLLNKMGANIQGAGSKTITIIGKTSLHGTVHKVIPDRIEAATYLIAAAATRGKIELEGTCADHLHSVMDALSKAGAILQVLNPGGSDEKISCEVKKPLKPVNIITEVFPGFPTDVQAQWMALMCTVKGKTLIKETIFENRFLHAAELRRMGAQIEISGRQAVITGVSKLSGADVMVSDLRAGAAMIVAGLMARGRTGINRIYHLDRGYEDMEIKFSKLGADIRRRK